MPRSMTKIWPLLLGAGAFTTVIALALMRHSGPTRCDKGWANLGPRCCAPNQVLRSGHCVGDPRECPAGFHRALAPPTGCVRDARRVRIERTHVRIGPNDWQSEQVPIIDKQVGPFWSDAIEVTYDQWRACAATTHCNALPFSEPGQPVVNVTPEQAQDYCHASGGRLPTLEERMALAAGSESRRYPWGQTGLVCRRAVFGVSEGPCAEGGTQPDLAGSHIDGQSPQGVLDLAGNVAELAVDSQLRVWMCGGSFRSRSALELKSWSCSLFLGGTDNVGFRCVYESPQ
jgi:formylglycine-generating enzyme required for sulfatase activity